MRLDLGSRGSSVSKKGTRSFITDSGVLYGKWCGLDSWFSVPTAPGTGGPEGGCSGDYCTFDGSRSSVLCMYRSGFPSCSVPHGYSALVPSLRGEEDNSGGVPTCHVVASSVGVQSKG